MPLQPVAGAPAYPELLLPSRLPLPAPLNQRIGQWSGWGNASMLWVPGPAVKAVPSRGTKDVNAGAPPRHRVQIAECFHVLPRERRRP